MVLMKNGDVEIQIDFEICDALVKVFKESTGDEFVGEHRLGGEQSLEWCRSELKRLSETRLYGKRDRLGIMKILYRGVVVGFSIPRVLGKDEYGTFKIDSKESQSKVWYRLGTIYILKEFRRRGIVGKAIGLFCQLYRNCVWVCDVKNEASERSAFAGGFVFSHCLWHRVKGEISLVELPVFVRKSLVFKKEEYVR